MRRPLRILLNAATALSLVLCVATAALWVRSYWVKDWFEWAQWTAPAAGRTQSAQRVWSVWSGRGVAGFIAAHYTARPAAGLPWRFTWRPAPIGAWPRPGGSPLRSLGFGRQSVDDPAQGYREFFVPHWCLASPLAVLPALHLARARRLRFRRRPGLCTTCGYDLRATPDRCPECGQAVSARTPSPTSPP